MIGQVVKIIIKETIDLYKNQVVWAFSPGTVHSVQSGTVQSDGQVQFVMTIIQYGKKFVFVIHKQQS